ncbi:MAG: head-tail connector protein [Sphingomonadaceae bacterium]
MLDTGKAELVAPLAEVRSYLRIESEADDAVLAGLIQAATGLVEAWIGRLLLRREVSEVATPSCALVVLSASPVDAVERVLRLEGSEEVLLAPSEWRRTSVRNGRDAVQLTSGVGGPVRVIYRAGLADSWNGLPEPLRLGVIRTAGYLHANRDSADDPGLPPIARQLVMPWRAMRLS